MQAEFSETIETVKHEVSSRLAAEGIEARVSSRVKSAWSIATKIERKQIALEQLSDMIGFRIVVPTVADCYRALGIVHTNWKVVPGRFKDYISVPKHNDYRSLHTTIVGLGRQRVELQIRTEDAPASPSTASPRTPPTRRATTAPTSCASPTSQAFAWLRQISSVTTGSSTEVLEYSGSSCSRTRCSASPRAAG